MLWVCVCPCCNYVGKALLVVLLAYPPGSLWHISNHHQVSYYTGDFWPQMRNNEQNLGADRQKGNLIKLQVHELKWKMKSAPNIRAGIKKGT